MIVVPVQNALKTDDRPFAPFADFSLLLGREPQNVNFLVDTGADNTLLPGSVLKGGLHEIWQGGRPSKPRGIGGTWPAVDIRDAKIELPIDGHLACMSLPKLTLLAPRCDKEGNPFDDEGEPLGSAGKEPVDPKDLRICTVPPLLGRDVFIEHKLSLYWDPEGKSEIRSLQDAPPDPDWD